MPFWRLYYHITWATVGRQPMLVPEIEYQVYDSIRSKVHALDGKVIEVNGTSDHVHLATTFPPSISISQFVGEVKGASSFHINHLPDNPHKIDWQRGYGVVSLSRDSLDRVAEYIRNQKEHHSSGHIWPSLEECAEEEASNPHMVREDRAEYDPFA